MTTEEFLIKKGLIKEGGKVLIEPISNETLGHIDLASLLEEYHKLKSKDFNNFLIWLDHEGSVNKYGFTKI